MNKLLCALLLLFISTTYAKDKERIVVGVPENNMGGNGIYIVEGDAVYYCSQDKCKVVASNFKENAWTGKR